MKKTKNVCICIRLFDSTVLPSLKCASETWTSEEARSPEHRRVTRSSLVRKVSSS